MRSAERELRIAELVFSGSGDCPAKVERVPVDNVRPRELNVPGHSVQSPRLELPTATMRWRSFRIAELVFFGSGDLPIATSCRSSGIRRTVT